MSELPSHFRVPFDPVADDQALVRIGNARFTVITSRLIRLEYNDNGCFTDLASQVFWYRHQPVPAFETRQMSGELHINTEHLHLTYSEGKLFSSRTLGIKLKEMGTDWRYGDEDPYNLSGTARTLDQVSGATKLESGLISRSGWALVDDSITLLFTKNGWLIPRENSGLDLYFFGYGHDYPACLCDYRRIAGSVAMIPRWALGNWWSRYWVYPQEELAGVINEFQIHHAPLSVCLIDMDWHLTKIPQTPSPVKGGFSGWTGYTWNRELFPDPDGFLAWLHAQGLKTALNLHPAGGVHPHEAMYPEMAQQMGIDPSTQQPVTFDIANPTFANAYFEVLHHPEESRGVDFWWMDWQQERKTSLPGLDPLWWLNHLHFYDLARDGKKRPFILSRWGGLGSHRYPIGFSGDTIVNWESLAFQPSFTATAANVGYGWWSHDIGGHGSGIEEPELYARWVQFGLFSPILRLHSSKNPFHDRRPWWFNTEVKEVAVRALQLRHALIPYLYSMAWRDHKYGITLIRPMYHDYPEVEEAYHCPQQYLFGTEMLVAPFVSPAHPETQLARQEVWLPQGEWYHFFTSEYYAGGRKIAIYGQLKDIPVFVKTGAVIPMGPKTGWGGIENPTELHIHLFAGKDGKFTLYEDDGETNAYLSGHYALTVLEHTWSGSGWEVLVHAAEGDVSLIPENRELKLYFHGVVMPNRLELRIENQIVEPAASYGIQTETLQVKDVILPRTSSLQLILQSQEGSLLSRRDRIEEKCTDLLHAFRAETLVKRSIWRELSKISQNSQLLAAYRHKISETQFKALMEVLSHGAAR